MKQWGSMDPGIGRTYDLYATEVSQVDPRAHVVGRHGAVVTSQPLASSVGIDILRRGGNAVDAAVAVAATLGVVEPYMSGPLGVGFMMIWWNGARRADALDFGGSAPASFDVSQVTSPEQLLDGGPSVAVPEALAGWRAAWERYGSLPWESLFAAAIEYAESGFPVPAKGSRLLQRMLPRLLRLDPLAAAPFLVADRPPAPGELLRLPALARTMRVLATEGPEALSSGALGDAILASLAQRGSFLTRRDLQEAKPRWVEPLAVEYRGARVLAPPPPSGGMQALETLGILAGFDLAGADEATRAHLIIEATKLAVIDRVAHDPGEPAGHLLDPGHFEIRRRMLDQTRARAHQGDRFWAPPGGPQRADVAAGRGLTTHFSIVDRDGNAVSCTQSLGHGFGAGIGLGSTGLFVNDMNWFFDLDPRSPNRIGPSRRFDDPMSPTMVLEGDRLRIVLGTPGSCGIPQTTPQVIVNLLDRQLGAQASVEEPRLLTFGERPFLDPFGPTFSPYLIGVESRVEPATLEVLRSRGHEILLLGPWSMTVGTFSLIRVTDGALEAGADRRLDNHAATY